MAHENLANDVMRLIQEQNRLREEEEFQEWYAALLVLPQDYKRELINGWMADVELQPLRWMDLGLTLLQSAKVTAYAQLANGVQGPPLNSFLPYPIFQSGAEIFLKGMWLCHHRECRLFDHSSYMEPANREKYLKELKDDLGHNLLKIIEALHGIPEYQTHEALLHFLKAVGSLVRRDYFPVFKADAKGSNWAYARYPKRFYYDNGKEGAADSWHRYSPQPFIERLFREAEERIDEFWELHAGLAAKRSG